MTAQSLQTDAFRKNPLQPLQSEQTEDARAAIVFAVMKLNHAADCQSDESRDDFISVIKNADFSSLPAGCVIAGRSSPCSHLRVILEGSAVSIGPDAVHTVLQKGSLIGLQQLLTNEPYTADIVAGDAGISMLCIKKEELFSNPPVYRGLLGRGLCILGESCLYELGKKLGQGQNGTVFEIVGQKLCAKILSAGPERSGKICDAIPLAIVQLKHAGIIGIHEIIKPAGGLQFIIMDLAHGITVRDSAGEPVLCRNLRQLMDVFHASGQCVPADIAARVFRHITGALLSIHASGYVHRDVKPEHIFIDVDESGELSFLLSDFSLAFLISTRPDTIQGTPHYCPPEFLALESEPALTGSADFYSLGAVCYELLTGRTVFDGSTILELARRHIEQQPDMTLLPPDTPIWLGKVIEHCLKKNPSERPTPEHLELFTAAAVKPSAMPPEIDQLPAALELSMHS